MELLNFQYYSSLHLLLAYSSKISVILDNLYLDMLCHAYAFFWSTYITSQKRMGNVAIPNSDAISENDPEYCYDAGSRGNVARYINHSCEPNLFVQCVLREHHDVRLARIVLFAADNIPPLQVTILSCLSLLLNHVSYNIRVILIKGYSVSYAGTFIRLRIWTW